MAITIGMGDFVYEYEAGWAKLPVGGPVPEPQRGGCRFE